MRATFFSTLESIYKDNSEMFVLTADLGYKLFDCIKSECGDRFYDVGVAEANMIGVAAGLSLSGKKVYCYSIVPFLVMRAFEQIRIDVAYHNLNVRLVGVGGGFTYGFEGITHFGLEDFALMRSLPNMTVVAPADPFEARCLARASYEMEGPIYIRLGRTGEPCIHDKEPDFKIGRAAVLKEGRRVAVFAIGNMVYTALQVAGMLQKRGIGPTVINMHTLKPLDEEIITQAASTHSAIFSLEEHNVNGGLGSALSEVLAENGYAGLFRRIGIHEGPRDFIGSADFIREKYGLTPECIYNKIMKEIR
ncbi:MAG: 1-deoxy-D-xylulose-5-phosphate synthase [Nitrospiraceae bacterium]|nr:MAG: 1-deoxy-D-xylulose-5-phosphate synthase [Nitrospiraceae bacterium]